MNRLKNNSGQLTVGLAFAFAGILAMFALVFNSSLNTREKMKLQTTSDYASLVAANVQRYNLNFIKAQNEIIETSWEATQLALQPSYAQIYGVASGAGIQYLVALGAATAATLGDITEGDCDTIGKKVDEYWRKKIIDAYSSERDIYASGILTSIEQANGLGFDQALYTFLSPLNLPQNLFLELENKLGKGFTVDDARNQYEQGALTTDTYAYEVLGENKDDPLFIPKNETRTFAYDKFTYPTGNCCIEVECVCCFGPSFGLPATSISNARITRDGDYTTHFYTGIRYTPPANLLEKMLMLGVKNPDNQNEKFGQNVEGIEGDLPLISRKTKEIQAVSAAKPYGGTFPASAFVADVTGLSGSSGTEFTGAKLFGIADTEEIGGLRNDRADACIDQMDDEGNIMGSVCYKAEDFLH